MPSSAWTDAPFVKVYLSMIRDHPRVWFDDALLAWWLRLLVGAHRMYPAPGELPRGLPAEVEASLVAEEIIDRVEPDGYIFHGLAALREAERPRGSAGGRARAGEGRRDRYGRWVPSVDAPLDDPSSFGGRSGGGRTVAPSGGGPGWSVQRPSDRETDDDGTNVPSSGSATRARTPARATAPARTISSIDRPAYVPCDDPDAHRLSWRDYGGSVGWKCPACVAARRDSEPTFAERMAAVEAEPPDDRPF